MPGAVSTSIRGAGDFTGAVTSGYYLTWNGSAFTLAALSGSSTNVLVNGGTVGTSGVGVVAVALGTVPTSAPADEAQLYAADYAAGDCRLQVLTETGAALWLGNGKLEAKAPASGAGNSLTLAGSAAVSGNTNGGDVVLTPGVKSGSGLNGNVTVTQGFLNIGTGISSPSLQDGSGTLNLLRADQSDWLDLKCRSLTARGNLTGLTGMSILWGSDTAIIRPAASTLQLSDNTAGGIGKLLSAVLVEANTAGSGSPNVLTAAESDTLLTNEGATAQNYHTLPSAAAGLYFDAVVQDSDGVRIVAGTGDTIRDVATVSATAGYIQSTVVGSTLRLVAINATEWVVTESRGTWTIDS